MTIIGSHISSTDPFIYAKDIYQQERLLLTKGNPYPGNAEPDLASNQTLSDNDQISISPEAKALQEETPAGSGPCQPQGAECCRLTLLRDIFERFIGRAMPVISSNDVAAATSTGATASDAAAAGTEVSALSESLALSLEYSRTESLSFSTTGTFQTRDNQEVSFSLELNFTRQVLAEQTLTANFTDAIKDPFNIQYNGFASEIRQTSFSFTIDCCSHGEEIVLDNTPAEETGGVNLEEGFTTAVAEEATAVASEEGTEIAALADSEETATASTDDFLDRLRVWAKDGFGNHRPVMFGVKGVGVMYHENQGLDFTLKKLDHFLNKMAKMAESFSQIQQTSENETTPAVSSQA
ncbi:MAG: hypothetical protein JXK94_00780 [Deltaproteobacteria bacterium]|nr:hypothetical protein [Deltaproteobacteria bacterium]